MLAVALVMPSFLSAASDPKHATIRGAGTVLCSDIVRSGQLSLGQSHWLLGFLTALEAVEVAHDNQSFRIASAALDNKNIDLAAFRFCRVNPTSALADAAWEQYRLLGGRKVTRQP